VGVWHKRLVSLEPASGIFSRPTPSSPCSCCKYRTATGFLLVAAQTRIGCVSFTDNAYGDLVSEYDGTHSYFHAYDGLGSSAALMDENANTTDKYLYRAFGLPTHGTGTNSSVYQWVGQKSYRLDTETQLYFMGRNSGYYDPITGTWIRPDPAIAVKLYQYAGNNPVNLIDPSGRDLFAYGENAAKGIVATLGGYGVKAMYYKLPDDMMLGSAARKESGNDPVDDLYHILPEGDFSKPSVSLAQDPYDQGLYDALVSWTDHRLAYYSDKKGVWYLDKQSPYGLTPSQRVEIYITNVYRWGKLANKGIVPTLKDLGKHIDKYKVLLDAAQATAFSALTATGGGGIALASGAAGGLAATGVGAPVAAGILVGAAVWLAVRSNQQRGQYRKALDAIVNANPKLEPLYLRHQDTEYSSAGGDFGTEEPLAETEAAKKRKGAAKPSGGAAPTGGQGAAKPSGAAGETPTSGGAGSGKPPGQGATTSPAGDDAQRNFDREIARHSKDDSGHWPDKSIEEVEALVKEVRANWDLRYTAKNGETIYLYKKKGLVMFENQARKEGTIFAPSSKPPLKYYQDWVRDHPGGM
jgi:RHS repeat-associated protein